MVEALHRYTQAWEWGDSTCTGFGAIALVGFGYWKIG